MRKRIIMVLSLAVSATSARAQLYCSEAIYMCADGKPAQRVPNSCALTCGSSAPATPAPTPVSAAPSGQNPDDGGNKGHRRHKDKEEKEVWQAPSDN